MDEVTRRHALHVAAAASVGVLLTSPALGQEKQPRRGPEAKELKGPLGIATYSPVIFAGKNGGGDHEYAASADPNKPQVHDLDLGVPEKGHVVAAWYVPIHSIADLPDFALIHAIPVDRKVSLHVAAYPGKQGRVRITLFALYQMV